MDDRSEQIDRHSELLHSRWGRWLVAGVVGVVGFSVVAPNVPGSPFRDQIDVLWRPAEFVGLEQNWGVFSPNPRDQSLEVRARIEFDGGSVVFWDVPAHDPVIGALREYRWQKWQERIRLDENEGSWEPTAQWIADRFTRDGVAPARVDLLRRWIEHGPLTVDGHTDEGWNEFRFHVWERDR